MTTKISVTIAILLLSVASRSAADDPCDKNHYILGISCTDLAVDLPIGKVGAVATDMLGNVYFSSPHVVFRLDSNGGLVRIAGGATPGFSGDGGPAAYALLNIPHDDYPGFEPVMDMPLVAGIAVDAAGNVYLADTLNNRIRKIHTSGIITTEIGGPASILRGGFNDTDLFWQQGIAVDAAGNLYLSTAQGSLISRAPDGSISELAPSSCGTNRRGMGPCGSMQIALDPSGNVLVPDYYCRVIKIGADATIVTVAGDPSPGSAYACGSSGDGGPAFAARLNWPYAVAADNTGSLFIADTYNHCIRKVDAAGVIQTVAGDCRGYYSGVTYGRRGGFSGDGGPASQAQLKYPSGIAVDAAGNLYIADTGNHRVRKVDATGIITTVAGNGDILRPTLRK